MAESYQVNRFSAIGDLRRSVLHGQAAAGLVSRVTSSLTLGGRYRAGEEDRRLGAILHGIRAVLRA